jgi:bifunctional DNA-binding transcriptional regulator/antitoxin component of YhaV-PrlF toxin-antitoxin module
VAVELVRKEHIVSPLKKGIIESSNSEIPKRRFAEMTTSTIQVRKKGSITLPMDLRAKYGVDEGDVFTLIDMGDGSFLLTPRISQVNRLGDRVAEILRAEDVSLDELLNTLDDERERYYQERYATGTSQHGKE